MVAPTDLNLVALHGYTFKGFVQFQVPNGSTWYRLKERQNMTFSMHYNRAPHYSDAGQLSLDPAGISHNFSMNLKITADMFDRVHPPTDQKTLSYWMYRCEQNDPVDVIFVASFENLAGPAGFTTEKYVNIKFVLDPSNFTPSLGASGGSPEIVVSGAVKSITSALRATTSDQ